MGDLRQRLGTARPSVVLMGALVLGLASTGSAAADVDVKTTHRVAGADRYATAVATVEQQPDEVQPHQPPGLVLVVSGQDFPDALAAGPAHAYTFVDGDGAAVVLPVTRDAVPQVVADELTRLDAPQIDVIGGPSVISDTVLAALGAYAPTVVRVQGGDRYATAAAIATQVLRPEMQRRGSPHDGYGYPVVIASGESFADGLGAGIFGARQGEPLLLTARDELPAATAELLRTWRPASVTVVGGTAAVSAAVLAQIESLTGAAVTRIGGADRYETAAMLVEHESTGGTVHLVSGVDFPDALFAVNDRRATPLYLTRPECIPARVVASFTRASVDTDDVTAYGGPAAVSDAALHGRTCTG